MGIFVAELSSPIPVRSKWEKLEQLNGFTFFTKRFEEVDILLRSEFEPDGSDTNTEHDAEYKQCMIWSSSYPELGAIDGCG